jgi:hypothetical protein
MGIKIMDYLWEFPSPAEAMGSFLFGAITWMEEV